MALVDTLETQLAASSATAEKLLAQVAQKHFQLTARLLEVEKS